MSGYPEIWLRDAITEATGAQVYPVQAPETATTPYIVYSRNNTERDLAMPTISRAPKAEFDLIVVTDSYFKGKELAEAIRLKCNNFKGQYSDCSITSCAIISQADGAPEEKDGETVPNFVQELSFAIRYEE